MYHNELLLLHIILAFKCPMLIVIIIISYTEESVSILCLLIQWFFLKMLNKIKIIKMLNNKNKIMWIK